LAIQKGFQSIQKAKAKSKAGVQKPIKNSILTDLSGKEGVSSCDLIQSTWGKTSDVHQEGKSLRKEKKSPVRGKKTPRKKRIHAMMGKGCGLDGEAGIKSTTL